MLNRFELNNEGVWARKTEFSWVYCLDFAPTLGRFCHAVHILDSMQLQCCGDWWLHSDKNIRQAYYAETLAVS